MADDRPQLDASRLLDEARQAARALDAATVARTRENALPVPLARLPQPVPLFVAPEAPALPAPPVLTRLPAAQTSLPQVIFPAAAPPASGVEASLALPDAAFAAAAYRSVLGRAPSADESRAIDEALARGEERSLLLAALKASPEGVAAGRPFPQRWAERWRALHLAQIPVLGRLWSALAQARWVPKQVTALECELLALRAELAAVRDQLAGHLVERDRQIAAIHDQHAAALAAQQELTLEVRAYAAAVHIAAREAHDALARFLQEQIGQLDETVDHNIAAVTAQAAQSQQRLIAAAEERRTAWLQTRLDEDAGRTDRTLRGLRDSMRDARSALDDRLVRLQADLQQRAEALDDRLARLQADVQQRAEALDLKHAQAEKSRTEALEALHVAWAVRQGRADAQYDLLRGLTSHLQGQEARLDALAARIGSAVDAPAGATEGAASVAPASFYTDLENRFRGSRETIRERLRVYLEPIANAARAVGGSRMLDLGCGRGELVELLLAEGYDVLGVDNNPAQLAECVSAQLPVRQGDIISFLRGEPPASAAVVSALHVIEHLPLPQQLTLIEQARRVLAPGGLLILETPNPENLFVGACWFHYDPTHRAPLPPDLLQFMVDRAGFVSSRILRMNDAPQQQHLPNLEIEAIRVLNHHLFGGRDYAVLAARPATA